MSPDDTTVALVEPTYLDINGERYQVRDSKGSGPAVLLLHGWPDDSTLWRYQQRDLAAAGYRPIAVDWLCHGGSSTPSDPQRRCSIPNLGRDTIAILDALDIRRAHLVAHDYGATVSWETVANFPDRFMTYTAISVGHSLQILGDIFRGAALRYHWLILHGLRRSVRYYLADDARRFWTKFASHPDAQHVLERLRSDDTTFFTVWESANPAPAVTLRLLRNPVRVPIPTLGIYSTQDEWMTPGQLQRSGRYVTGPWQYEGINGGHWVPLEQPAAVNSLLIPFLDRQAEATRH